MCWSSPGCIEELFISCQEIKNNCHLQFFCVYLLLPPFLSLRHTHTHIFNLPIHYNPLWNRISCLLCLVQQAYTYFSLSQDAAEPSNTGCHPTRLTHSLTHATKQTQGQISPCLVLCAAHNFTQPTPICLPLISISTRKVRGKYLEISSGAQRSGVHHIWTDRSTLHGSSRGLFQV